MENKQPNYYKTEPEGERDENEDHELSSFLQELIYPEPDCIDTLMNPNPNPNLGHPEEDGPAVEVDQPKNGGDGFVDHDQPSSIESSSSAVSSKEPISRSNLDESLMIVQAARVSDLEVLGPGLDQITLMNINANSVASSVDTGGDPMERDHTSNPKRKTPSAWTQEEHMAFLHGIRDGFNGDWKNMSQRYVKRRSPTQIASHAQKYFKRQQSGYLKRRKSINDITLSNIPIQSPSNNSIPNRNPNPSPNPNPYPNWVEPVGTELPPLPPLPPRAGNLYMASQGHEISSSSSSSRYIPILSPLPQRMVPPNYSVMNPHDQRIWRGTTTMHHNPPPPPPPYHHQQPPTITSSWPLQQRSYDDYYPPPMMFNPSLSMDYNPVNHTSHLTFNPHMGRAPDQRSNNINFYP